MQTTDFLSYLGFKKEVCQFVAPKVCYTTWIDSSFDLGEFSKNFGDAFVNFEEAYKLLRNCGHELDQPEGWEYFNPSIVRKDSNSRFFSRLIKGLSSGDGHNANRVENMKQSEDDDFIYRLSWIEKANTKGWVFHYRLKHSDDQDLVSIIKLLELEAFDECPLFEFEQCFWLFLEYQTKGNDVFEGNAELADRYFDSHAKDFSVAARKLIQADNLMSKFGFGFLKN